MTAASEEVRKTDVSGKFYYKAKRILDIFGAVMGLSLLAVPLLILMAVVYLDDPGPVLFLQDRVGKNGKIFRLYKLRTMKQTAPAYLSTEEMENPGDYVTKTGRILRKLSLDEIPQLFNVLRGDMSLIGPRPLIPQEKEIHALRAEYGVYTLRPGITGLAQINGRDQVEWDEKVRLDAEYLHHFGFSTDISIFLRTIPKVVDSEGVRLDEWEPEAEDAE